jgi:hypothetical protein
METYTGHVKIIWLIGDKEVTEEDVIRHINKRLREKRTAQADKKGAPRT